VGTPATRATSKTRRAKVAPARVRAQTSSAQIDAIFADLPDARLANGSVPDLVRRNRRERAKRRLVDAIETRGRHAVPEAVWTELRVLAMRWAQKGFVDAFSEADAFEIRCAEERAVLDADARGDVAGRFAAAERAYRREVERKYGRIEIRGLQLSERVFQDLETAYVPLHVEERPKATPVPPSTVKKAGAKHAKNGAASVDAMKAMVRALDRPRVPAMRALARHPRLLVVGGPGSGKSTLVAYLATCAARGELAAAARWKMDPVPFVVPVRSLGAAPVTAEALAGAAGAETWFLNAALERGRALLLIDGLDEARLELTAKILPALTAMLDAYPSARVMVTTRPAGGPPADEPGLADFATVELVTMTVPEVHTFIERWCLAAELSLGKARAHAEADASAAAEDLKKRVRLRGAIEKLAQTPLLCSVLCVVHRFLGESIPERRIVLYDAMTNVLLYEWDRAKFPEGASIAKLDAPAKRALLGRVASAMHRARVAELPETELIRHFTEQLPDLGRPAAEATAIVAEIRDRSGVLVERTPGSFAFSHLTFQEFLAAEEMVKQRAYDELLDNYGDAWWHEVVVLAAGIPGAAAVRIVRGLLDRDGEEVSEGTMLAAQCVETAVELSASLRSEVEQRVTKLVPPKTADNYTQLAAIGDIAGPVLLRGIDKAETEDKASILFALGHIGYEPALGTIGRFLRDPTATTRPIAFARGAICGAGATLAYCATIAALLISRNSDSAISALSNHMARAHPSVLNALEVAAEVDGNAGAAAQILLSRYRAAHPKGPSSAAASKRAARSG
jgi:hypothetical protein